MVFFPHEYLRRLGPSALFRIPFALFRFAFALIEGFAEFCRLKFEDRGLQVGELALLIELLGLDLEHPGLVIDFFGLLAEGADRVDGRDDREHGEDRSGDSGDLARQVY